MAKIGDIARDMAQAPLADTKGKSEPKATPVPLPSPTFAMVANFKTYEDRNDKSKQNGRLAHVYLTQGAFTCEASIYLEVKVEQRADGRHEQKSVRFSLPKGVKLLDSIEPDRAAAWKDSIIDAFLEWRKENGGKVAATRSVTAGFRSIDE